MATVITSQEGEKVLFTIRKSFFRLSKQIVKILLLLALSVIGFVFFSNEFVAYIASFIFILALTIGFYYFMIWFYDVYIITNQRVILVEQKSIFSKEFSEIELAGIKDVTYSIRGVVATILKYGTVKIKTEDGTLELDSLSDPDEVQEMLKKLSANAKKAHDDPEMSAAELIDLIVKNHKK